MVRNPVVSDGKCGTCGIQTGTLPALCATANNGSPFDREVVKQCLNVQKLEQGLAVGEDGGLTSGDTNSAV